MPIVMQRVAKHIPATMNTSVAMQRSVDTKIEEDILSMIPPREYVSGPVVNLKSVEQRERKRSESSPLQSSSVQSSPSDL
jgi:hypothetical protein